MAKQILNEQYLRMQKLAGLITEEQLNEATSYQAIKDSLTSAMESMGYKYKKGKYENEVTYWSPFTYEKRLSEKSVLIAEVIPDPKRKMDPKPIDYSSFTDSPRTRIDYDMIGAGMYFLHDKEKEEKKFFGLVKKKFTTTQHQNVMSYMSLDLAQNSTEEAVNKITTLFKEGEAKARGML
jgi:hypothetical protein